MKILGIESSSLTASVAVLEDDVTVAEYTVNFKKTHSQTLLPMLDEIVGMVEMDLDTLDAIAVSAGPGSFTGLRIGSATAKGLGLALDKPLIHVPTVDSMAYNLYGCGFMVCPIMDARRNQVYTGIYDNSGGFSVIKQQCALDFKELAAELNGLGREVIFTGDGVPVYREQMKTLLTVPYRLTPGHLSRQRAAAVAALGEEYLKKGLTETAAEHGPDYLRKSQAERERDEHIYRKGSIPD